MRSVAAVLVVAVSSLCLITCGGDNAIATEEGPSDEARTLSVSVDPVAYKKLWLSLLFKATDGTKALCRD
jgi:hypothetical protein